MASYEQLPGTLNLSFKSGDFFSTEIDFSVPLSSYSVNARMLSAVNREPVVSFVCSVSDPSQGKVNISLSKASTAAIPRGTYFWGLAWETVGGEARTALEGFVEVS